MSPFSAGVQPVAEAALEAVAAEAVERARVAGAEEAEAIVESTRSFTARALNRQVETLKQSVTHGLGLRVIVNGAVGFVSTNDFRSAALEDLTRRVVILARFATPDPANGLPAPEREDPPGDLRLFDPAVLELPPDRKIDMALTLERVALGYDPRIRRTEGAAVSSHDGAVALVNSHGLARTWSGTAVSAHVVALADDREGKQQTGYYGVSRRWLGELPPLEELAREAARRAVQRIGARPVPAARVPVVMHPDIGAAWLSDLHGAFSGAAVVKQASWLTDRLGQAIAAPIVTLVDDGRMPGGIATEPYDGEGIPTRRNVLIDRGRCAMFEFDAYYGRRMGTGSTGSAQRSYASVPGVGHNNLYLEPGTETPEAILARVDRGFYMDDQGSFGFNSVTGDYSYQAQGHWIERGEKAFPVEGVTVASNSLEMLRQVVAVGNDLRFEHAVACPTLLIAEMTVSGGGEG